MSDREIIVCAILAWLLITALLGALVTPQNKKP